MRKVVTRRFLSQDRGLSRPLILGTPSSAYSTMSHTAIDATMGHPAQEFDEDTTNFPAVLPPIADEPIVTRKELWSYYCTFSSLSLRHCPWLTTCLPVYYNGDNVRRVLNLLPEYQEFDACGWNIGSWSLGFVFDGKFGMADVLISSR
jgi:hypothetical protein